MVVGVCIVELHLPGVQSLKSKRSIIKSIIARVHREFNVSCAEIDGHDFWQSAVLGIAVVSTSAGHVQSLLENVVRWIGINRPNVEIVRHNVEIV
jgi:hypothetical protein